ncbi:NUMOD3 domain-containing DNA-binding protein [Paenibacillus luteus]|uniref:NUMOD3 domain-containing DNA-binding protein n=1 Tax=Paenibacillus luteus TaxID=2545753 RepID=UPI001143686F|nr:NUMOD3 domain-containing DNA-binding protein [Paenibacillus luteus]
MTKIRTAEHSQKISEALKGRKLTPEHIEKLRQAKKGKKRGKRTEETREKISKTLKGRPLTEERKKNIREAMTPEVIARVSALKKGVPLSKETRQKISESHKGKKLSLAHKEKIRLTSLGRTHTEETKEKLRELNTGKKMSEEAVRKMALTKIGKTQSLETRMKRSAAMKLKEYGPRGPFSEETILKISGDNSVFAILTEELVLEIRELYLQGNHTHRSLAEKYKVAKSTITAILSRRSWKHI